MIWEYYFNNFGFSIREFKQFRMATYGYKQNDFYFKISMKSYIMNIS